MPAQLPGHTGHPASTLNNPISSGPIPSGPIPGGSIPGGSIPSGRTPAGPAPAGNGSNTAGAGTDRPRRPARPRPAGRRPSSTRWWEQQVTVPTALNVPVRKLRRRARLITAYVWVAAVLLPIALFATAVLAARQLNPAPQTGQTNQISSSVSAAQAQVTIERWIANKPSPLPGGRVITFTGATTRTFQAQQDGTVPPPVTTYAFVVADQSGHLFTTTVQMVTSDATGAVAIAEPALLPVPPADDSAAANTWPWPGVDQTSQQASYTAAIAAWARAYTSGDPDTLRQAIGDPEQGRSYMPLSGLTLTNPSVGPVGAVWGAGQQRGTAQQPAQALVRVTFDVIWAGQPTTSGTAGTASSTGSTPRFTYDLLLDRADTASPVVVAWGSSGTGTDLKPYSNAVVGRTLAAAETQAPSQAPSATPTAPRSTPR